MRTIAKLFGAALCLLAGVAAAADYVAGNISVRQPWARATPRGAAVGGAYLSITNNGSTADRLTGGSSPVANRLEVHTMEMDEGVAKMHPVEGGLEIKAGQTVELKPGSLHVMLVGLKQPLLQGQHVKATLDFEKAGKLDIEFTVEPIGANGPGAPEHAGH